MDCRSNNIYEITAGKGENNIHLKTYWENIVENI